MVGHLLVPDLTERTTHLAVAAARSPACCAARWGSGGVVITDALGMGAVAQRWSNPEAAQLALQAGADLAMIDSVSQTGPTLDHLIDAVRSGELRRSRVLTAVVRSLELRDIDLCTRRD